MTFWTYNKMTSNDVKSERMSTKTNTITGPIFPIHYTKERGDTYIRFSEEKWYRKNFKFLKTSGPLTQFRCTEYIFNERFWFLYPKKESPPLLFHTVHREEKRQI